MKMIVRAASAAFLLFAAATTALAVSTTATPISSSTWTDLGAGPLVVQTLGDTAQIAVSDASPAANDRAFILYSAVGNVPTNFNSTSHIWAKALNNSTTVISAPISAAAGGGGGSSGPVYGPTAEGTAPAQPPIYNGYKDAGGLTRGVSPATPFPAATYDTRGSGSLDATSTTSKIDIPLNNTATVGLTFGTFAGGSVVSFFTSNDGGTTYTAKGTVNCAQPQNATTTYSTSGGQPRVDVSGATNLRVIVSTPGTGTIPVNYNLSAAPLSCPNLQGTNVYATASAGGITSRSRMSATVAGTNVTLAKTGAGRLYKIYACNTTTTDRFIKFYDTATAPTVGTTPVLISRILPRSTAVGSPLCQSFDQDNIGWSFASGLYYSILGTAGTGATYGADSDTTAVAAGDVVQVSVEYQ